VISILAPILLLVLLGVILGRIRFLGRDFLSDLNKLVFWIALPALLFRSIVHAEHPGPQMFSLLALLLTATAVAAAVGWLAAILLRLPSSSYGTLSQSAFRGNLAYIGIPVLAYAFEGLPEQRKVFGTVVLIVAFLMMFFNVLAVVVLSIGRQSEHPVRMAFRSIIRNPLLLSGLAGIPFAFTQTELPLFLDRTLESLGSVAVPVALLCIGGSLAHARLGNKAAGIFVAAAIKTFLVPVIVFFGARMCGFSGTDFQIALVLAACPTAATSYVMVRQMHGDGVLASGSIVVSTILSAASIPLALFLSR
jgi:predicted permease